MLLSLGSESRSMATHPQLGKKKKKENNTKKTPPPRLKIYLGNYFPCCALRAKEKCNFVGSTPITLKQNHWVLCCLGVSRVFPAQPVWVLLVPKSFRPGPCPAGRASRGKKMVREGKPGPKKQAPNARPRCDGLATGLASVTLTHHHAQPKELVCVPFEAGTTRVWPRCAISNLT